MSRALVWKHDPSIPQSGIRLVFLPKKIKNGPRDDQIEIAGTEFVKGDKNGDFIFDPWKYTVSFDAVHTFVIVRQVLTMYQRILWRIGRDKPFYWQWGPNSPLKVHPMAGNQPNAYYSRKGQCLKFFYFQRNGKLIYTNRSFDVVTHECGHAILDSLRPGYWASWQSDTGALHESFADITVILSLLAEMHQCEAIIVQSCANLRRKTFFSSIAEEFGEAIGHGVRGLRSADNDLTLLDVSNEIHDRSQVFTGAFYDILADIFDDDRNHELRDDAETLFRVGQHMAEVFVEALLKGPPQNATFKDIAEKMIALEKNVKWKSIIRDHFESRLILGKDRVRAPKKPVEVKWAKCTCCLSKREHLKAVEEGMRNGQSCVPYRPKMY